MVAAARAYTLAELPPLQATSEASLLIQGSVQNKGLQRQLLVVAAARAYTLAALPPLQTTSEASWLTQGSVQNKGLQHTNVRLTPVRQVRTL